MSKEAKVLRSSCPKFSFKIAALVPASTQQNVELLYMSKTGPLIPKKIADLLDAFFKSGKNIIAKYINSLNMSLRKHNRPV